MDVADITISCEVLSAICQHHLVVCTNEHCSRTVIAESLAVDMSSIHDFFGQDILPSMTLADWQKAQADDPHISSVIGFLTKTEKPRHSEIRPEHTEVKLLL